MAVSHACTVTLFLIHLFRRGLVTGLISAPFIINNFVAAEIAEGILPNWYV